MNLKISSPAKVFLLGEYSVLNGGLGFLMAAGPRFEMQIKSEGSGNVQGIHPDSPAGIWIRNRRQVFQNVDVAFQDPYHGIGGLGASSAQFLMTYTTELMLKNPETFKEHKAEVINNKIVEGSWRAYRMNEYISQEGVRPSGADLVAQTVGGFSLFQSEPFQVGKTQWQSDDYEIVVVHTNQKLATHEHLRGLKNIETDELQWIAQEAMEALNEENWDRYFASVNDYHAELLEMGLVAEHTKNYVASLISKPFVLAAKGSGAMGSDLLTIYIRKENRQHLVQFLEQLNLKILLTSDDVSGGLIIENDTPFKMSGLPPKQRVGADNP
jgi:mevalonate kinase